MTSEQQVELAVTRASEALAPDVVRIRYTLGEDWSGSAAVFFRVVLSDDASRRKQLREASQRVSSVVYSEVKPDELGLQAYFNFRSASEQEKLREDIWA